MKEWTFHDTAHGLHLYLTQSINLDQWGLHISLELADGQTAHASAALSGIEIAQASDPDGLMHSWIMATLRRYVGELYATYLESKLFGPDMTDTHVPKPVTTAAVHEAMQVYSDLIHAQIYAPTSLTNAYFTTATSTATTTSSAIGPSNVAGWAAELWPQLQVAWAKCPACFMNDSLWNLVIHLNDKEGWSREAIADWLDTLNVDLDAREVVVDEDGHAVRVA